MKIKWTKMAALGLSLALVVSAAACGKGSDAVSGSDAGQTIRDTGETFCRGVWAADDGDQRTGYYIFTDESNGACLNTGDGTGLGFTVETDKTEAVFHMGEADDNSKAHVRVSDNFKRVMTWESPAYTENLTLMPTADPDKFEFYTAEDLADTALQYYGNLNGVYDLAADWRVNLDGNVELRLYREADGNKTVVADYLVDSLTGKGKDVNENMAVDFS